METRSRERRFAGMRKDAVRFAPVRVKLDDAYRQLSMLRRSLRYTRHQIEMARKVCVDTQAMLADIDKRMRLHED